MRKGIWQEFDGYDEIVAEIEASRKVGKDYTVDTAETDNYINRLHPAKLGLRVVNIIEETPSTKTIRLVSREGYLPPFQAGQYISLFVRVGQIRTARPYSLSSPPNHRGYYDITVRRVENGLVSNWLLDEVQVGDHLESSGPEGNFFHNPVIHPDSIVGIAGGSGVTPFMSMIREIVECGLDRRLLLLFGNRGTDDIIFHDQLIDIASRFDNINYVPVIENPDSDYQGACGLITSDLIQKTLDVKEDHLFLLCGPQGMYDFCLPEIEKLGVPKRRMRKEMYGPPLNIETYPGWPDHVGADDRFTVTVKGHDTFEAKASVPLLVSLEVNGIVVPSLCRSGECSQCRVKVIAGEVFQPEGVPVRSSDRAFGYVHSCVSYPVTDLEIII
jgi:ferredoxin-NADP reductase